MFFISTIGCIKLPSELGRRLLGFVGAAVMAIPMELLHIMGAPIYRARDKRHPPVLQGRPSILTAVPVMVAVAEANQVLHTTHANPALTTSSEKCDSASQEHKKTDHNPII